MGKWTLEHHDEVLRTKVKNMVQGAVKRMGAEKESPSITYEAFVEELDEGDAFTASLFDILVKEMAERRTRPDPADRRFISERTAKALHMQAAPLHVYRTTQSIRRSRGTHRSFPVLPPRYSTFHDVLSESDGDEDYGTALDTSGSLEGARINTDLYDAYFPSTVDLPGTVSRRNAVEMFSPPPLPPVASADSRDTARRRTSPRAQSPPTSRSPWYTGFGGAGTSALSRQSTIRRSHHSRTTDFSEFTTRRRSAIRNSATEEDGPRTELPEPAPRPSAFGTRPAESTPADQILTYGLRPWSSVRRRSVPTQASLNHAGSSATTSATIGDSTTASSGTRSPSSSELWYSLTSPPPAPVENALPASGPAPADSDGERPPVIAPRLRRGGLRPPEVVLAHPYAPTHSVETQNMPPLSSITVGSASSAHFDAPGFASAFLRDSEPPASDSR